MQAPVWVLYQTEAGDFAEAEALTTEEGTHIVVRDLARETVTDRICTEPFAFDWDKDGDLDFLIGNFAGTFLLAINEGTATEPKFKGTPEFLMNTEGKPLKLNGNHGAPYLVDWDGDGDVDLISGSGGGGVQIAINEATEDEPYRFEGFVSLVDTPTGNRGGICPADTPVTPSGSTRVCVCDYNADGKLDLIVGDCLRRSHPAEGLTVEEASQKQLEWSQKQAELREELNTLRAEIASASEEDKKELEETFQAKNEEMRELYGSRTDFIQSVSTGHVWVYLRK